MRALVVYESMFGTNLTIANAVAEGLGPRWETTVQVAGEAPTTIEPGVDLLVVGGPNHMTSLPRPGSREQAGQRTATVEGAEGPGLREWLAELSLPTGQRVAVWDTRITSPAFFRTIDHASRLIVRQLRREGAELVADPEHFLSADGEGALVDGEEQRARDWGHALAARVPVA
jgi:hypothetical protein